MSRTPQHRSRLRSGAVTNFLVLQVALLAVLVSVGVWRLSLEKQTRALPELRERPRLVLGLRDEPTIVSDEQLHRVLKKLLPKREYIQKKINHADHALRFWGADAAFAQPQVASGGEMQEILINHDKFRELYGEKTPAFLTVEPAGVNVRTRDGDATASHVDHTLACLAEAGLPLSAQLRAFQPAQPGAIPVLRKLYLKPAGVTEISYQKMVEHSLRQFSLNQAEYEWSALTYALVVDSSRSWMTTEGQVIDFDLLARRLLRETPGRGVCFGNHRLYTLVILLRVDEDARAAHEEPFLTSDVRREIVQHLQQMTAALTTSQHTKGFWNGDWPTGRPPSSEAPGEREGDRREDRILATGHALEWWAMLPVSAVDPADDYSGILPQRDTLVRAANWLVTEIDSLPEETVHKYYTFLTHAGRSLGLWRKLNPGLSLARYAEGG